MKKLELSGKNGIGLFALVDNEDFAYLNQWKWQLSNRGYASRPKWLKPRKLNKQTTIYMHRFILDFPVLEVDHINMNKLDNRKENLRLVTDYQNALNRGKHKDNKSGFKGVSWVKRDKKYKAEITVNKKYNYLGLFDTKEEAAQAYNNEAKKYHGEFAKLNQI